MCPKSSVTNTIKMRASNSDSATDVKIVDITTGHGEKFFISIPVNWNDSVQNSSDEVSSTVRVSSRTNEDLVLLMTFFSKTQSFGMDQNLLNKLIENIKEKHSQLSAETLVESTELKLTFSKGVGKLITYADNALVKKANKKNGEFAFVTTGVIIIGRTIVSISLLTNDRGTANYAKAMAAIQTMTTRNAA
ncbi:MAG: hypothetical protein ACI92E_002207 [Oceanicoccus sp.]|jgi:hypothetical protein